MSNIKVYFKKSADAKSISHRAISFFLNRHFELDSDPEYTRNLSDIAKSEFNLDAFKQWKYLPSKNGNDG